MKVLDTTDVSSSPNDRKKVGFFPHILTPCDGFPLLYTKLVVPGIMSMERLMELLVYNPRRRFGISDEGSFTVFVDDGEYEISADDFISKGKSTPFLGEKIHGECVLTVAKGKLAYRNPKYIKCQKCKI